MQSKHFLGTRCQHGVQSARACPVTSCLPVGGIASKLHGSLKFPCWTGGGGLAGVSGAGAQQPPAARPHPHQQRRAVTEQLQVQVFDRKPSSTACMSRELLRMGLFRCMRNCNMSAAAEVLEYAPAAGTILGIPGAAATAAARADAAVAPTAAQRTAAPRLQRMQRQPTGRDSRRASSSISSRAQSPRAPRCHPDSAALAAWRC